MLTQMSSDQQGSDAHATRHLPAPAPVEVGVTGQLALVELSASVDVGEALFVESDLQVGLMVVLRDGNEQVVIEGGEGVGEVLGLAEVVEAAHHRVKRLSWHYPDTHPTAFSAHVGRAAREDNVELFHGVNPFMTGATSS